jgi:putative component of membrane protein insertase Oxa1/YidC/SpoIIIJ protein YidD
MEAVERYGVLRGTFMALARLLRCHPFAQGGYDPVVRTGHSELSEHGVWRTTNEPGPTTALKKA